MKIASKSNWSRLESKKASGGRAYPLGFTLTELVVVLAVLSLFAVMLAHTQASTRVNAMRIQCASNLKQVGLGFRLWAASHNGSFPMAVSTNVGGARPGSDDAFANGSLTWTVYLVMSNELSTPKIIACPTDFDQRPPKTSFITAGPYAEFTNNSATSYFVGRYATRLKPRNLLSGDRNIYGPFTGITDNEGYGNSGGPGNYTGAAVQMGTNFYQSIGWTGKLHGKAGNICLADGSVQQVTISRLRDAFSQSGDMSPTRLNFLLYP